MIYFDSQGASSKDPFFSLEELKNIKQVRGIKHSYFISYLFVNFKNWYNEKVNTLISFTI